MIIVSLPKVFIWIDAAVSFISVLGSKRGIAVSNKKPSVYKIIQKGTSQTDTLEPIDVTWSVQTTHTQTHQKKESRTEPHTHADCVPYQ